MIIPTTLLEANFVLPTRLSGESAALILLVFFGVLSSVEFLFPREGLPKKRLYMSYQTNISLFIFNSTVMSLLSVSSLFILAEHYSERGLLRYLSQYVVQVPYAAQAVLSFLLLDLLLYLWHKACHRFDCLWMFHRVHHNDPYLNVSTAFRIHVLELFITNLLKAGYILLLGINEVMVLANEAIITLFVMFHHTNIAFKGEKLLGRLIIVPYLHRAHHSTQRNEHDSNYGAVLSLWDRLFGTLAELQPAAVGIKGHSPQDFINLVKFGFTIIDTPLSAPVVNLDVMIAEAAYYKAEKRNFYPGYELLDWLEAKREIINMVYGDKAAKKHPVRKTQPSCFKFMNFNMNLALKQ